MKTLIIINLILNIIIGSVLFSVKKENDRKWQAVMKISSEKAVEEFNKALE